MVHLSLMRGIFVQWLLLYNVPINISVLLATWCALHFSMSTETLLRCLSFLIFFLLPSLLLIISLPLLHLIRLGHIVPPIDNWNFH